jgi:large subunit ribosomal protein L20
LHALSYAYTGRKLRKRDFRKLWILRIGGALKNTDSSMNYSTFIHKLRENKIEINRKMLSEISIHDFDSFNKIVKSLS